MRGLRVAWLWAVGWIVAAPLVAQVDTSTVVLLGRVIDARSGISVPNVAVAHPASEEATFTDGAGLFRLRLDRSASYELQLSRFGYEPTELIIADSMRARVAVLEMAPNPVEIEGFRVDVELLAPVERRLESRMRAHPGPAVAYSYDRIQASGVGQASDFVRRAIPGVLPCTNDPSQLCFRRRGANQQVRLCIDELPAYGGLDELNGIPIEELYKAEVYDMGAQVRIYTRGYVARNLERGLAFIPIEFGC